MARPLLIPIPALVNSTINCPLSAVRRDVRWSFLSMTEGIIHLPVVITARSQTCVSRLYVHAYNSLFPSLYNRRSRARHIVLFVFNVVDLMGAGGSHDNPTI